MAGPLAAGADGAVAEEAFVADIGQGIEILHVEDDPEFADLVATFLERERDHFDVMTETDPKAAIDRLTATEPDCVVSDYDMPGLDGLKLLEHVREHHSDLPFVLFTGKGSEEIASEAISRGVTEYLQKGRGTDQYEVLANRIEQAVARHRAEQQVIRGFSAIEAAHDGISLLNEDGEFIYVNEAYAEITGYDREELLGKHWELLYDEADLERVYEEMLPAAKTGEWSGETTYVRKDGETVVVGHRLVYSEDDTLICTITDTSAVAEVRDDLSVKERAMDAAPVGIVLTDPERDNEIIYANDGFVDLTGYDREEVLGRNCRFLQGEETDPDRVADLRAAIDAAEPTTVELRNYRRDGEQFWNRVTIAPLFDDDGDLEYFVGFQEDVTDRQELREQQDAWLEMMEWFGRVLSHDIRSPLDVAAGRIELARETGDVSHLDDVEAAIERIDTLADDLAEALQTGQLVTDEAPVEVGTLAREVWSTLDTGAASLQVAGDPTVVADEAAFRRLLENLLGNALEHGAADVGVRVGALDGAAGFYVEDDGPGIPEGERDTVFEPGYTTKDDGTGFGLVSVAQIVAAHGWDVSVAAGRDGGARFEVTTDTAG